MSELDPRELESLKLAKRLLETPTLAARITDLVGRPLERGVGMLPEKIGATIHTTVQSALTGALRMALSTMDEKPRASSSDRLHALAGATSGAVGGFFGLPGLVVELPATTVIMLRSIGDIARSEGHEIRAPEIRIACLEVFALGGPTHSDDATETGYYAVRSAMAKLVADAVQHVAEKGMVGTGSPVLVRFLEKIAVRFGVVVQEKVALELFPVVGAVSGALINTVFISHFQGVARGHFIVKRLEDTHGIETVRLAYAKIQR